MRLERDNFHVLSMQGKVVQAKPQALQKKKDHKRAVGLDSEENNIQVKDIVEVIDGLHSVRILESHFIYAVFMYLVPSDF